MQQLVGWIAYDFQTHHWSAPSFWCDAIILPPATALG